MLTSLCMVSNVILHPNNVQVRAGIHVLSVHRVSKKQTTYIVMITSENVDQYSYFFTVKFIKDL